MERDVKDTMNVLEWFSTHAPFDVRDSQLRGIASGYIASTNSGTNCDIADEIGESIMSKMDEVTFTEVVLRKVNQMKSLDMLNQKMKNIRRKLFLITMSSLVGFWS